MIAGKLGFDTSEPEAAAEEDDDDDKLADSVKRGDDRMEEDILWILPLFW